MKKLSIAISLCAMLISTAYADSSSGGGFQPAEKNIYILSPHPDDSVLTFGGLITNNQKSWQGKNVHYNVFYNISSWAIGGIYHDEPSVTGVRLLEDVAAYDELFKTEDGVRNYTYSAANQLDAPLMGVPNEGNFSYFNAAAISAYNDDYQYVKSLLKDASSLPGGCAVFVNMGLPALSGYPHIDHFILREATIKAVHDLGSREECKIYFGEDLPYLIMNETAGHRTIDEMTSRLHLEPIDYSIDVQKKNAILARYISQDPEGEGYFEAVKTRAAQLDGREQIYLFPSKYYTSVHTDPSCNNQQYCEY